MKFVRAHFIEVMVGVLILLVLWAYRSLVVGEMQDEIRKISAPEGLPAKRKIVKKLRRMEQDARTVDSRLNEIRLSPMSGQSLATILERFHRERGLPRDRARIAPRGVQTLEGNLQEEQADVLTQGMSLSDVIQYLTGMETLSPVVRIRSLKIQKTSDTATLMLTVGSVRTQ